MGGPTVNQGAVQQEQQNQNQAQQYAAQQQQAALQGINQYIKSNPAPQSQAAPIGQPAAQSPATMGGGNIPGQQVASKGGGPQPGAPGPGPTPGPPQPQAGTSPLANLTPQQQQALVAALRGQGGQVARAPGA